MRILPALALLLAGCSGVDLVGDWSGVVTCSTAEGESLTDVDFLLEDSGHTWSGDGDAEITVLGTTVWSDYVVEVSIAGPGPEQALHFDTTLTCDEESGDCPDPFKAWSFTWDQGDNIAVSDGVGACDGAFSR